MKILLFILFIIHSARAEDCSRVDLTRKAGPVRNQDGLGWCSAFSFSDSLGAEIGKRISAQDLSLSALEKSQPAQIRFLESQRQTCYSSTNILDCMNKNNELDQAINKIKEAGWKGTSTQDDLLGGIVVKQGVCLEEDFPSNGYKGKEKKVRDAIINQSKDLEAVYDDAGKLVVENKCEDAASSLLPFIPKQNFNALLTAVKKSSDKDLPFNVRDAACKKRYKGKELDKLALNQATDFVNGKVIMDEALKRGKLPMFDFYAKVLDGRSDDALHSVVVTGRKKENGQCLYQIKNSWGPDCSYYQDSLKATCERGFIWLSEKEMQEHFVRMTSFRNI